MKKGARVTSTSMALGGIFLLLLLLKNAEIAANGIKKGLTLSTEVLIPSLFPFLVLSELILLLGVKDLLEKWLSRPCRTLFGLSGAGSVALTLGWLLGVPVGAAVATSLLEKGRITSKEHRRLLLISSTPSMGFLVGAVGGALFGNRAAGLALYLISIGAAALCGVLLHAIDGKVEEIDKTAANVPQNRLSAADFTGAVKQGFFTLLQVIAFVIFFSALTECVAVFVERAAFPQALATLTAGIFELTAGVTTAVRSQPPQAAFLFTAFFAGYSGLSICLQIFSVAGKNTPRLGTYLAIKLLQGLLTLGGAKLYLTLACPALSSSLYSSLTGGTQTVIAPRLSIFWFLFAIFFLFCHRVLSAPLVHFYKAKK